MPGVEAPGWPGWAHDRRTAEYWTGRLGEELGKVLTQARAEKIARNYAAANPGGRDRRTDAELAELALAWLPAQGLDFAPAIAGLLTRIRADGALIGAASAHARLAGRKTADLGGWKPGRTEAARHLLDSYNATVDTGANPDDPDVAGVVETRMKHVARALALGTAAGLAAAAVGSNLRDALAMGLGLVAITEVVGAISQAAIALFGRRGIELGQWVIDPRSKVCPVCVANSEAPPRAFGQPYPSGHRFPPAHGHCACAVIDA